MVEVVDGRVDAREEQRFVTAVRPPDEIRRPTVGAVSLQHLAVAIRLPYSVAPDHDAITYLSAHEHSLLGSLQRLRFDLPRL